MTSLHFHFVPVRQPEAAQQELNALLARSRVVSMLRNFVNDGANSGWAVCVEAAMPAPAADCRR